MSFFRRKSNRDYVSPEMAGTVSLDEYEAKKTNSHSQKQKPKYVLLAMILILAVTHTATKRMEAELAGLVKQKTDETAVGVKEHHEQVKSESHHEQVKSESHHEQVKSESLELLEKLRSSVQNDNLADGQHTYLRLIDVHAVALPHEEQPTHDVNLGKTMEGKDYHEYVKNKTLELLEKMINSINNDANLEETLERLKKADSVAHPP